MTERGFGWLAAEVIQTIESGEESTQEKDHGVAEQRRQLELSIVERQPEKLQPELPSDFLDLSKPILGDDQIRVAVRLITWRLSDAVSMLSKSSENLSKIFDTDVHIQYQIQDSTTSLDAETARSASHQLQEIEDEIVQWLISQPSTEES